RDDRLHRLENRKLGSGRLADAANGTEQRTIADDETQMGDSEKDVGAGEERAACAQQEKQPHLAEEQWPSRPDREAGWHEQKTIEAVTECGEVKHDEMDRRRCGQPGAEKGHDQEEGGDE